MAATVLQSRSDVRIGQIIGAPGTGKTATGKWLASEMDAIRICAWSGMRRKALLSELAKALVMQGHPVGLRGTCDSLTSDINSVCDGLLFIVDEANHLNWSVIEALRIFVDEGGAALILAGTDLLARTFNDARTQVYLAQMAQRIGAKRVTFQPLKDEQQIAAYIIQPRFGAVSARTAKAFYKISKGYWRAGLELADACARVMRAKNIEKLDEKLVQTAGAWMARQ